MDKSMNKQSDQEREERDDFSYLNMQQFQSPILAGSNLRSINPKNSDRPMNLQDSHQTSFNFDPEMFQSPHNLYNLSNRANDMEIAEMRKAAADKMEQEFIKKDEILKKRRKYSDQFEEEIDRKKKITKEKKYRDIQLFNPNQHREFNERVIPMITPMRKIEQNKIFDKDFNKILKSDKIEPKPERKRPKRIRRKRQHGCSCKSTNCLKLHCVCFKKQGYCLPSCRCTNCLNTEKFEETRKFAIEKTKLIFNGAFIQLEPTRVKDITGRSVDIYVKGCNCKKGCWRKYCDCKKANGVCSYICKCVECENDKVELPKEEIQRVFKPCSRKKHKLVIKYDGTEALNNEKNIIEFMKYKNTEYIPEKMKKDEEEEE